MNYIGSKNKLSDFIISEIKKSSGELKTKIFAELFAGTGIISRKIKPEVKTLIVNDIEYYSFVLLRNSVGNNKKFEFDSLISQLNNLSGRAGFIYKNYCSGSNSGRNYFTDTNGKKIDSIRLKIENLYNQKKISEDIYFFLLASLLESADKVANTASVYGAFLKHIKRTAQKELILRPEIFEPSRSNNLVYNTDANELIKNISGDILYLDPPYNNRQYGANYHLLNTIALYKKFEPRGKTGLPDYTRSMYCYKREVESQFEELIKNANFSQVYISYNNEGILPLNLIKNILKQFGKYKLVRKNGYARFKADKDVNRKFSATKTTEYLHILNK
jgi:adenine-specific DNA-methyltransferase